MANIQKEQQQEKQRRKIITHRPANATPNYLTLLKSCVGKELSRMALPVEFNEPLSMLQRQTEELEYTHLLDLAAQQKEDPFRRMAFVCVFALSGYSTLGSRPTKPFNPLLGETFECDRRADRGWRSVAEQVSHHPPGSALHVESNLWTLQQSYIFESKLKSTNICLRPTGQTVVEFSDGEKFTYGKLPTSTSLDSIMGNGKNGSSNSSVLPTASCCRIECSGQLEVSSAHAKCILTFHVDGKKAAVDMKRRATGTILDGKNVEKYRIEARWDQWAKILKVGSEENAEELIWRAQELSPYSHLMHNFTQFAIELNEDECCVAPTDSRRRPDQRLCELGEFAAANRLKKCLEQAQRERILERGKAHQTLWFTPKSEIKDNKNAKSTTLSYQYNGAYWKAKEEQKWHACPELFAV